MYKPHHIASPDRILTEAIVDRSDISKQSQSTASHLFARTRSFHLPTFIRPALSEEFDATELQRACASLETIDRRALELGPD